ncbi:hypothetical protein KPH14_002723 [Odynerus spinipes]|uniref:Uncharacterized protein n=1 Tax=Odynerus spinipes TaxID=1348599 RepID=A0AAD9RLK2_9HYME|nr:hypothetical protein KPH14_002723 [Odynerus spinipes]
MDFENCCADVEPANIDNQQVSWSPPAQEELESRNVEQPPQEEQNFVIPNDGFEELYFSTFRSPSSQDHRPKVIDDAEVEGKKDDCQNVLTENLQQSIVKRSGPKENLKPKRSGIKNHRSTRRSPDQTLRTQIRRIPEIPTQVFRVVRLLHHRQFLRYVACFSKSKMSKSFVKR